ncbi:MAG: YciI family protein [Ignavibacteriota bacterium]
MKYFLINIHYAVPLEKVVEATPEHRAYLKTQYDAGIMLFSGPKVPRTAGVLFARAEKTEVIDAMIAADPFNKLGIGNYEVVEIAPVMWAEGLNKIFETA